MKPGQVISGIRRGDWEKAACWLSPLDHPIWAALTTGNKALAQGGPLAWRYPVDVAPFAAISDTAPEALEALRALIPPEGRVALFTVDKVRPPIGLETELEAQSSR